MRILKERGLGGLRCASFAMILPKIKAAKAKN
jgi:hypothetical protein